MCTAACFKDKDCYFGRNLDYEFSYGEQIVVTPRNFEYGFRYTDEPSYKYAIIGMAHVSDGYPLYYDAMNEKGLGMAGLNFVGNAYFNPVVENKTNVCSFEFIPWILCQCETVEEAIHLINEMNLCDTPFSASFPPASLHYMISDSNKTITVEIMKDGVHIYDNPVGVLTNNPPFDKQMFNLNNYMYLSTKQPENTFSKDVNLSTYSRGMGALGLPGDLSSASRFVRVAFTNMNVTKGLNEQENVSQFFHILGSVEQQKGLCEVAEGKYEYTIYTSCCNLNKGIYYYSTYHGHTIKAVDMHKTNLDNKDLTCYPIIDEEVFFNQN